MGFAGFTVVQTIQQNRIAEDDKADMSIAQCRYFAWVRKSYRQNRNIKVSKVLKKKVCRNTRNRNRKYFQLLLSELFQ